MSGRAGPGQANAPATPSCSPKPRQERAATIDVASRRQAVDGLDRFAKESGPPSRLGLAAHHAVTFAAGLRRRATSLSALSTRPSCSAPTTVGQMSHQTAGRFALSSRRARRCRGPTHAGAFDLRLPRLPPRHVVMAAATSRISCTWCDGRRLRRWPQRLPLPRVEGAGRMPERGVPLPSGKGASCAKVTACHLSLGTASRGAEGAETCRAGLRRPSPRRSPSRSTRSWCCGSPASTRSLSPRGWLYRRLRSSLAAALAERAGSLGLKSGPWSCRPLRDRTPHPEDVARPPRRRAIVAKPSKRSAGRAAPGYALDGSPPVAGEVSRLLLLITAQPTRARRCRWFWSSCHPRGVDHEAEPSRRAGPARRRGPVVDDSRSPSRRHSRRFSAGPVSGLRRQARACRVVLDVALGAGTGRSEQSPTACSGTCHPS